jgi:hypothetical protein
LRIESGDAASLNLFFRISGTTVSIFAFDTSDRNKVEMDFAIFGVALNIGKMHKNRFMRPKIRKTAKNLFKI